MGGLPRRCIVISVLLLTACGGTSGAEEAAGDAAGTKGDDPLDADTQGEGETQGGTGGDDACPDDPDKDVPGQCGCGVPDDDGDDDGVADCEDGCPNDPSKAEAGACGCGEIDDDGDGDGVPACEDNCVGVDNASQADGDGDAIGDACDNCVDIPNPDQEEDADGVGAACSCGPAPLPCEDGAAGGLYECAGVDMLARLDLDALSTSVASDLWGWVDPDDGREYALLGVTHATVFIDLTHPYCPRHVGSLPTASENGPLRDIKVYADHAFVVAEANGHGMQVFDLTRLRGVQGPESFDADARYTNFGRAHNVIVDPQAGFAYGVGSTTCGGGLHAVDIRDPLSPEFAGCYDSVGYIHDAQCLVYDGPDVEHVGTEICIIFSGDTGMMSILDMTSKDAPVVLSQTTYSGASYAHQGWLTEDQQYLLLNDEFDESIEGHYTKTYIWDVRDLDAPEVIGAHQSDDLATDHNLYTLKGRAYQANYRAGLRILDLADVADGTLEEIAFFDTDPTGDGPQLDGAFTAYPYYDSGVVVVSDMSRGVFILRPTFDP